MSSFQVCQVSFVIISDQCTTEHLENPQGGMWLAFYEGFTAGCGIGVLTFQTHLHQKFSSKPRETKTRKFLKNPSNSKRILISAQCMNHNT